MSRCAIVLLALSTLSQAAGADAQGPGVRTSHVLVYHEGLQRVVMITGSRVDTTETIWAWDGAAWTPAAVDGPPARGLGAAAFDSTRGVLVLHGGAPGRVSLGDTWEWDGTRWSLRDARHLRDHHAMTFDRARQRMVFFGGLRRPTEARDRWEWIGDVSEWDGRSWKTIEAPGPGGRVSPNIAYDAARRQVLLFGGGAVGAFRVVSSSDLRDHDGSRSNLRSGDLRHLREQGLIETARVPGYRDHAVALTKAGHSLLERHRDSHPERHQTVHAGLVRSREREHDLQVYRAYEKAEERLRERGAHVERVVLDHELKSDYQRWLHEHDNDHDDYDGHPERTTEEIQEWASEHDLPYFDDEVHFPDLRVEYVEPDGRWDREDIEVVTPHYRGAHSASVARSGFSTYSGLSISISGSTGGGGGGRGGRSPSIIEELFR